MARRRRTHLLSTCPNCGAQFRAGRLACPECGSDANTGWRDAEDIDYQSVEIPDTYEEFIGAVPPRRPLWPRLVAVVLITAFVLAYVVWF